MAKDRILETVFSEPVAAQYIAGLTQTQPKNIARTEFIPPRLDRRFGKFSISYKNPLLAEAKL